MATKDSGEGDDYRKDNRRAPSQSNPYSKYPVVYTTGLRERATKGAQRGSSIKRHHTQRPEALINQEPMSLVGRKEGNGEASTGQSECGKQLRRNGGEQTHLKQDVVRCSGCDIVPEKNMICLLQHPSCKTCVQRMINSTIQNNKTKVFCPKADCKSEVRMEELSKIEPCYSMVLLKRHLLKSAGGLGQAKKRASTSPMDTLRVGLMFKKNIKTPAQGGTRNTVAGHSSLLPLLSSPNVGTKMFCPLTWTGATESVELDSPEGVKVRASLQDDTLAIRRIVSVENKDVWHSYCLIRQEMLCRLTREELHEQFLFTTVPTEQVSMIVEHGFRTTSSGQTLKGICFAKQAILRELRGLHMVNSASLMTQRETVFVDQASPLSQQETAVVITQVLLGTWKTMSRTALVAARCEQSELCDSWVDNDMSPSRVVVFKGSQCYPAYVVWV